MIFSSSRSSVASGSFVSFPITSELVISLDSVDSISGSTLVSDSVGSAWLSTALLLSGLWLVTSACVPHPARDAITNPVTIAINTLFFISSSSFTGYLLPCPFVFCVNRRKSAHLGAIAPTLVYYSALDTFVQGLCSICNPYKRKWISIFCTDTSESVSGIAL